MGLGVGGCFPPLAKARGGSVQETSGGNGEGFGQCLLACFWFSAELFFVAVVVDGAFVPLLWFFQICCCFRLGVLFIGGVVIVTYVATVCGVGACGGGGGASVVAVAVHSFCRQSHDSSTNRSLIFLFFLLLPPSPLSLP